MKTIDRIQGMIDLYHQAGKSANAVRVMMEYFKMQGLMSEADIAQVETAISESPDDPLDVRGLISERDALMAENKELKAGKVKA